MARIKFTPAIKISNPLWDIVTDMTLSMLQFTRVRLRVSTLIGTQPSVTSKGMKAITTDWRRPIVVVRIGRKNYIRDGHHRVTRARQLNQRTITADIIVRGL